LEFFVSIWNRSSTTVAWNKKGPFSVLIPQNTPPHKLPLWRSALALGDIAKATALYWKCGAYEA